MKSASLTEWVGVKSPISYTLYEDGRITAVSLRWSHSLSSWIYGQPSEVPPRPFLRRALERLLRHYQREAA